MNDSKKTLYIGGLADNIDMNILRSVFAPFGDIIDISLPIDYSTQKHKGFAFVEYQLPEDAADAIDNMDHGEILGKTIRVNIAKPMKFKESSSRPIWADDEYLRKVEEDKVAANGQTDDSSKPETATNESANQDESDDSM